ncbi:MAG TPA: acyl CoA:acetate/3-ketoacid CoA transferase subunit beta, partial [Geoalkalibacter subterraneus]|nr:acyl CoA:acetate/3-ketoacid CoA transferase subunit beta [Geoalkalibacter subterraneus]
FHSENGFVGMGPPLADGTPDHHVVDAGGRAVTLRPGAACFDSVVSFGLVRGQHLDLAVLGAFQVAVNGDLANWKIPGKLTPGMGGAMELAQKARKVVVLSRHSDKLGRAKLVAQCDLPLTAAGCVDTLITERAVFRRRGDQLQLASVHPTETAESVLQSIDVEIAMDSSLESWDQEDP